MSAAKDREALMAELANLGFEGALSGQSSVLRRDDGMLSVNRPPQTSDQTRGFPSPQPPGTACSCCRQVPLHVSVSLWLESSPQRILRLPVFAH